MSKHIFLSTDDPGVGGVGQYNHSLLCGLAILGYRVTCLQPQVFNNQLITAEKQLGIQHLWLDNNAIESLPQILIEPSDKPDLVICSNTNPFSNFGIKQIAIQLGIPYVVVEGLVEPHLADKFDTYLNELSHHYTQAKSVIAVSFENLNLLHGLFRLPKYQGEVIYYGRPSEYFTVCDSSIRERLRQNFSIPSDAVVCFTAARIETRKGYQYQLEVIKQLMSTPVWPQLYFIWAGAGIFEPQLEAELKEAVKQLGIINKVIFLGQRSDVSDWLNAADIFVFPSLLEGMPLCVMEAMAKGLPVIASAVSGIPEELGETGILLADPKIDPQITVKELVTAIQDWVVNPQLRDSIGQACKQRAENMFKEERMIKQTVDVIERALLPTGDYVSPGFEIIQPDQCFPNMIVGDTNTCQWPYLRRDVPHNWYVDQRQPTIGFLSRDEAHILYNTALKFKGKKALEIGCWLGWSACHLALTGVELDVVDPLLAVPEIHESVSNSLRDAGVLDSVNLVAGYSPKKVEELAAQLGHKWPLIFIDGDHESPGPLNDAIICEQLAEPDALIIFHDLNSPDVAQGLDYLKQKGWNTMVYQTMQIMGVAWRGSVEPVQHQPDPKVHWHLPEHLRDYDVSGSSKDSLTDEFLEILNAVRPYTLLSEARLFSLYSLAKQICLDNIPGNFVECGAYKGGSAALLAVVIQRYSNRPRMLYAFDTFEGMPEPTEFDHHNGIAANLTGFGFGTLKAPIAENFNSICQLLKVQDIVIPVKGLFAQTLPQYKSEIGSIAFLHADGDWYESTMDIFNTLYDSVVFNGIVQVDDYGHWEGCRKAIHEFERFNGERFTLHQIDYTGIWFQKFRNNQTLSPTILVDAVFFQINQTGIARVWISLLEEWVNNGFAQHIVVLDRAGTAPKISGIRYRSVPLYDYSNIDADREMIQQVCDEESADLFISSYYTTATTTPSVFMAYDMIPEVMGWDINNYIWKAKHYGIQNASAYIAISKQTARDLVKFFTDISIESVTVAHCGVKSIFSPATLEKVNAFKTKYGISKPYFILVGVTSAYKNSALLFKAFSQNTISNEFVIVCTGSGSILTPEFRAYTSNSVVHMLQLSDEELITAYSGAVALVYPSKYEGFGMPVVEAMACGCPVITCPNASIPEVAGEAAIYVNNDDVEGLVNALYEVQKLSVRNSLIAAGLAQAKQFSWPKMAKVVSSALIEATLLPLNLKESNLIIFPDWSQPEDLLGLELEQLIGKLVTHPDSQYITLLIDVSNSIDQYAEMLLSTVIMSFLLQENLDVSERLEISLVGTLGEMQWEALLPRIQARIVLEHENKQAVAQAKAEILPDCRKEDSQQAICIKLSDKKLLETSFEEFPEKTKFIDRLSSVVDKYKRIQSEPSLLKELCLLRKQMAELWLDSKENILEILYLSKVGEAYKALLNSGIQNERLTEIEEKFVGEVLAQVAKGFDAPKAIQSLLVVMLYCNPSQLSFTYELSNIPHWLVEDYFKFTLQPPSYFQDRGEVDSYYQYMKRWVNYLHSNIISHSDSKLWQDVTSHFTQIANFIFLYFNNVNLKDIYTKRADIMELFFKKNNHNIDYEFAERSPERKKIRLAILASHFGPQTETFATLSVYKHLNREIFEIILFTFNVSNHRLERYCTGHADAFIQLPADLVSQVQTIREADIDILFISTNVTAVTNQVTLLALHRLARVQVVDANSPVTTGMRHIDYYISSKLSEPEENAQQHYTETLVTLDCPPQCFDFATEEQIFTTTSISRESMRIADTSIVYVSGANYYKITPELETAWAKIIASVPNSILLLYPFNPNWSSSYPSLAFQKRIAATFTQHGIPQERLILLDCVPNRADVKERLKLGDIYLDSYPYSGMTSLIDPLEVGLPTVVMETETSRSRKGASLLRELQIPDLITNSEEAYIQLAVTLGKNPSLRQQKAEQIKQKMQDNPRFLDSRFYSAQMGELFQNIFQKHEK